MIKPTKITTIALKRIKAGLLTAVIAIWAPTAAYAGMINGTGLVTPDIIFGSGNGNGGFTGETNNNIEVGLRGKQRYPKADIFNYDGIDTYIFDSTVLTTNPANRSIFNFEWSINVDQDGTSGMNLDDFVYLFSFDTDPTAAVAYIGIDPFNTPGWYDHSLGNNGTANGAGIESADNADLLVNMGNYNVAQQSANLGFGFSADPDLPGSYKFKMEVFDQNGGLLSSAEITVIVTPFDVPSPATFPLLLGGIGLLSFMARRRQA
jgi:hypothetical protein